MKHLGETRLAYGARPDQLPDLPVGGGFAQVVVRAQHHSDPAAGIDHLPRLGDREGQRLLAQHVLAGRCRLDRLRPVQLVGGADVHGSDLGIAKEGREARVSARDPVARRVPGASLRVGAEHRHHLVVGHRSDRVDHPLVRDGARPDEPPAQRPGHVCSRVRSRGPSGGAPAASGRPRWRALRSPLRSLRQQSQGSSFPAGSTVPAEVGRRRSWGTRARLRCR